MPEILSAIRRETTAWVNAFVRHMPGQLGSRIRSRHYPGLFFNRPKNLSVGEGVWIRGGQNISVGDNVIIGRNASFEAEGGSIKIGDYTAMNHGVWIGADLGEIEIGANAIFGPYIVLRAANHNFTKGENIPVRTQGHSFGKIIIGDNVLVGSHVTFLDGARVGRNAVIGAGAVVRSEIPENTLAAGVPAKVIRRIEFDKSEP